LKDGESQNFRKNIIYSLDYDILVLCETFLTNNNELNINKYVWISHNRTEVNARAVRGSGGVGILLHDRITRSYSYNIVDMSQEGILWLHLKHKLESELEFYICACYLPPETSSRGDIQESFFISLLTEIYTLSTNSPILIMGDFNKRLGNKQDVDYNIDSNVPARSCIDNISKNPDTFIDFLRDCRFCVLNGRFDISLDNFTCLTNRGQSVVDYICTGYETLKYIQEFRVLTVNELIEKYRIQPIQAKKQPDHSVIMCSVDFSDYSRLLQTEPSISDGLEVITENVVNGVNNTMNEKRRLYSTSNIPLNIFGSPLCQRALTACIDRMIQVRNVQEQLDNIYQHTIDVIKCEMDNQLEYRDVTPALHKRAKRKRKPFWNSILDSKWKNTCMKERKFRKNNSNRRERDILRQEFVSCRKDFDRTYRKFERQFFKNEQEQLALLDTNNPKKFWEYVKNLGPSAGKRESVFEVYDDRGNVRKDPYYVLQKWKESYANLFQKISNGNFDEYFLDQAEEMIRDWEQTYVDYGTEHVENHNPPLYVNDILDGEITSDEIRKCVNKLKTGKACGHDGIPNEILKCRHITDTLHTLFNMCFRSNKIPRNWNKIIIKPIPKKGKDPRIPGNTRGINLISNVAKLYTGILNSRLQNYIENGILNDEQSAYRKMRNCIDNAYILTTVIRHRKRRKMDTYVCYVDYARAFDTINHTLLFKKILDIDIKGQLYRVIKGIYSSMTAAVSVNGYITTWFAMECGIRQGDTLAPTIFNIYINDLVDKIKELKCGLTLGDVDISIIVFADDVLLITDTPAKLQTMLDSINMWCQRWHMTVNQTKTQVMHFRASSKPCTKKRFTYAGTELQIVPCYRYVGLELNEHLDFTHTANTLASAGSRALGGIIHKFFKMNGMNYATYLKLFDTCVAPVLNYGSEIWGFKPYQKLETVQHRFAKSFLGTAKTTPTSMIIGDCGLYPLHITRKVNMVKYFHKLSTMSTDRLLWKVFNFDHMNPINGTWCKDIKSILCDVDLAQVYDDVSGWTKEALTRTITARLQSKFLDTWMKDIDKSSKLEFYRTIKNSIKTELYISCNFLTRYQRRMLAMSRAGTLPLEVERGRWRSIPRQERICRHCDMNCIEDLKHFINVCPKYDIIRDELKYTIERNLNINNFDMNLDIMFNNPKIIKTVANYLIHSMNIRNR